MGTGVLPPNHEITERLIIIEDIIGDINDDISKLEADFASFGQRLAASERKIIEIGEKQVIGDIITKILPVALGGKIAETIMKMITSFWK